MDIEELATISKALSEPKRIEILKLTSEKEMCATEILSQFNITQPTLSHHMKQLTESNLTNIRKDGKLSYYSSNNEKIHEIINYLKENYTKK